MARQFVLSLVQTADRLPIAHEVHPGNTAEAKTLLPMIRSLLERWPLERVVLVFLVTGGFGDPPARPISYASLYSACRETHKARNRHLVNQSLTSGRNP